MSEKRKDFSKLVISLSGGEGNFTVKATLKAGGEFVAEEHAGNLFFAMDKSLKKILSDAS